MGVFVRTEKCLRQVRQRNGWGLWFFWLLDCSTFGWFDS